MTDLRKKIIYNFNRDGYPSPRKSFFGKHFHDYYEILLFKTGDIDFIIENIRYKQKKNDLFLIPPGTYHFMDVISDKPYDRYVLQFPKSLGEEKLLNNIFNRQRCINVDKHNSVTEWFDRFNDYYNVYPKEQFNKIEYSLIFELLMILNRVVEETDQKDSYSEINPIITNAIEYIDNNFTSIDSIKNLANALYLSKSYLFYCFKKHLDISPMQYVRSKQLVYARQLIREGVRPTEINEKCGIPEYTTFFRLYKKKFGVSPSKDK